MVRVRIAPSPTGFLHIGTARTALFNYLFAKKFGGRFILRIEDTDAERSDKKYEKDIFEGLSWLGINADESPEKGGAFGPYRQSERIEIYKTYLEKLLADGNAFYCFHSEHELDEEKKRLMTDKKPLAHWCEFRDMPLADAQNKIGQSPEGRKLGVRYIIRFKTPRERAINFTDLIRGELSFKSGLIGDFSIAKDTNTPLYNFAVAIDDETMKISHIIRGEDHISNTPKQILLIEALGFAKPEYAHLPLILGVDRSKLSKRHGATSITEYRNDGYLPAALFNFMALLGWNPGGEQEIFSAEELISEFSFEKIQKAGAIFDITKLDWMNGEYIRQKPAQELTELLLPYLKSQISNLKDFEKLYIQKIIALEQPRLKKLSEIGERTDYFFRNPTYAKELLLWKGMNEQEVSASLKFSEKIIKLKMKNEKLKTEIEKEFLKEMGDRDKGVILWPLRVALTGKKASPGPFEILEIMGRETALERIAEAKRKIV
jgi:nondiscriminating glutamyl-tRNA synthetase